MVEKNSHYQLIDSGDQKKLERIGGVLMVRPSTQAVWSPRHPEKWDAATARFTRTSEGTGNWQLKKSLPRPWQAEFAGITWNLRNNDFGHVGIFPEQEECWQWIRHQVDRGGGAEVNVLNLFGYTGGSTLAAAAAGAQVCHLDASKTSVGIARENAAASGLVDHPIRWIVDDATVFTRREIRRGRRYQGIILDPPSFGRGPGNELWKIDEHLPDLLELCRDLLADDASFMLLTCHSPGYTPQALANLLDEVVAGPKEQGEMLITSIDGRPLPSGSHARWSRSVEGN